MDEVGASSRRDLCAERAKNWPYWPSRANNENRLTSRRDDRKTDRAFPSILLCHRKPHQWISETLKSHKFRAEEKLLDCRSHLQWLTWSDLNLILKLRAYVLKADHKFHSSPNWSSFFTPPNSLSPRIVIASRGAYRCPIIYLSIRYSGWHFDINSRSFSLTSRHECALDVSWM